MSNHPIRAEFEDYVQGLLPAEGVTAFEAHVASCDACTDTLAREARLELGLEQVAARPHSAPQRVHRWAMHRWAVRRRVTVGIAASAAMVLAAIPAVLTFTSARRSQAPHEWVGGCLQHPTERCIARADEEGVFLPAAGARIPRYDEAAAEPIMFPTPAFHVEEPR
jgi:anti-sigma factor RsiW